MSYYAGVMIENYILFLKFLDEKLQKFFTLQNPYIMCKKGCALCCKDAQIPYSKIEMDYLMMGAWGLSDKNKRIVAQNVQKILKEKQEFKGDKFVYDCPFLINNECSVYNFRGIVCRTFGLLSIGEDGNVKIPFCCYKGLNYSNVMDFDTKKISSRKYKELGFENEPAGFNIGYEFLTDKDFEKTFKLEFGEKKPLIDWFEPLNDKQFVVLSKNQDEKNVTQT